jgi:hypothetical protein
MCAVVVSLDELLVIVNITSDSLAIMVHGPVIGCWNLGAFILTDEGRYSKTCLPIWK